MESLSSCGPQENCQSPPPIAQEPNPMGVSSMSELPSFFLFIVSFATRIVSTDLVYVKHQQVPPLRHAPIGMNKPRRSRRESSSFPTSRQKRARYPEFPARG